MEALREVAESDPERWSELSDLDLELDRLERQGLAESPRWHVTLARYRWLLVGLLEEYRERAAPQERRTQ